MSTALSNEIMNAIESVSSGYNFAGANGWYLAKVLIACVRSTKNEIGQSISMKLSMVAAADGVDAGTFWHNFAIIDKNGKINTGAVKVFDRFCRVCGMNEKCTDVKQLEGLTCSVYVEKQNNIAFPYRISDFRPSDLVESALPPAAIRETRDVSFAKNKEWADRFMPEIMYRTIEGRASDWYIRPATEDEDKHRATDLVLFASTNKDIKLNIGVRTLDYDKFFKDCGGCFTLRDVPEPGTGLTEIDKALQYVVFIISSFAKKDDEKIRSYFIVSMLEIADQVGGNADKLRFMGRPITDRDGKTFYIFKMADFPNSLFDYGGEIHPDIAALDKED